MSPLKIKKVASKLDAYVGFEIEGLFQLPRNPNKTLPSMEEYPNVKRIDDIETYEELRALFKQSKSHWFQQLKHFVINYDLEHLRQAHEDQLEHVQQGDNIAEIFKVYQNEVEKQANELLNTAEKKEKVSRRFFDSFKSGNDIQRFIRIGNFQAIYGVDKNYRLVLTSPAINHYQHQIMVDPSRFTQPSAPDHDNDDAKRTKMMQQLKQTKFAVYIREVVYDSSISKENRDEFFAAEIVTEPMPYKEVESFIQEFFKYIRTQFSFEANNSTGFHINVSIKGRTDIDFCKMMVFLGERHELQKYAREENTYTQSHFGKFQQRPIDTKDNDILSFIDEVNKRIDDTSKYHTFNINHWVNFHYIEFRIAGGNYSNKEQLLLVSIDRYVRVMDIATDPEKNIKEYHVKVSNLMAKQEGKHQSQLQLKPDTINNAKYNIEQKVGYDLDRIEQQLSKLQMLLRRGSIHFTSSERIWLRRQSQQFGGSHTF